jgi:hypothetical protein
MCWCTFDVGAVLVLLVLITIEFTLDRARIASRIVLVVIRSTQKRLDGDPLGRGERLIVILWSY